MIIATEVHPSLWYLALTSTTTWRTSGRSHHRNMFWRTRRGSTWRTFTWYGTMRNCPLTFLFSALARSENSLNTLVQSHYLRYNATGARGQGLKLGASLIFCWRHNPRIFNLQIFNARSSFNLQSLVFHWDELGAWLMCCRQFYFWQFPDDPCQSRTDAWRFQMMRSACSVDQSSIFKCFKSSNFKCSWFIQYSIFSFSLTNHTTRQTILQDRP